MEAMTSFLENSGAFTNKGRPVPSITIHTPHDRQASYGLHLTSTFIQPQPTSPHGEPNYFTANIHTRLGTTPADPPEARV